MITLLRFIQRNPISSYAVLISKNAHSSPLSWLHSSSLSPSASAQGFSFFGSFAICCTNSCLAWHVNSSRLGYESYLWLSTQVQNKMHSTKKPQAKPNSEKGIPVLLADLLVWGTCSSQSCTAGLLPFSEDWPPSCQSLAVCLLEPT